MLSVLLGMLLSVTELSPSSQWTTDKSPKCQGSDHSPLEILYPFQVKDTCGHANFKKARIPPDASQNG